MAKRTLCLYVEDELIELAKSMGINMSTEFNEWMKIRMNKMADVKDETKDPDLIIAEYRAEIMKLETQKERQAMQSEKDKELNMIVIDMVDGIIKEKEETDATNEGRFVGMTWPQIITYRATGLMFLIKKRMNKILNLNEAEQILTEEIKKRGIEI